MAASVECPARWIRSAKGVAQSLHSDYGSHGGERLHDRAGKVAVRILRVWRNHQGHCLRTQVRALERCGAESASAPSGFRNSGPRSAPRALGFAFGLVSPSRTVDGRLANDQMATTTNPITPSTTAIASLRAKRTNPTTTGPKS